MTISCGIAARSMRWCVDTAAHSLCPPDALNSAAIQKQKREETPCRCSPITSPSSPAPAPASAAPLPPAMRARARAWWLLDINEKAAAETAKEIRDAGGKAESFSARRHQARRLHRDGQADRRQGRAGLDPRQQCRHRPPQRHAPARRDAVIEGLGGHHRDQPHRRVQRHARVPARRCAPARAASSISARSSPSCMCARRARRPTPPPSTACSASPGRSPPSSARTACASMRSAPA